MEWKMIDNRTFLAEQDGYILKVVLGAALGSPYWEITKEGKLVSCCYYHSPTHSELAARVQAEGCLRKLIIEQKVQECDATPADEKTNS
jgi:hypothetical protein